MRKRALQVTVFTALLLILSFDTALPQGREKGVDPGDNHQTVVSALEAGQDKEGLFQEEQALPSSGTSPEKPALFLCGVQPSVASRPLAVKIDNAPQARPQSGLSDACIVYEHLAEGGITRFTAIYYGEEVKSIGPVRSARRVDLQIIPQFKAVLAHVGGSQAVMEKLRRSNILDLDQFFNPGSYFTLRFRTAPHNIYTTISRLRQGAQARGWEMTTELPRLPVSQVDQKGDPAEIIGIPYSSSSAVEYRYDSESKSYRRFTAGRPHLEEGNKQIEVKNLVIQKVDSWFVDVIEDAGGAPSLDFDLVGEGNAWIFHDGYVIHGKWERPSLEATTQFYDEQGQPAAFVPGNLWIALVPPYYEITIR
ncbi:MAG: DUF3048 domain-containing protein [Chloroflexi bacterium]|nr:DUF3048 domain-containing protein [Chloroflexota bacterium]